MLAVYTLSEHPPRRAPRPVGHPGHRLLALGPLAGHHRGPGHLPDRHGAARRAEGEGDPGVLGLRLLVRLRHLPGRHRPLLGPIARGRVSLEDTGPPPAGGPDRARARRDGRRVGLPVRPGRSSGHALARPAALVPGLDAAVRRSGRPGRGRGRVDRRLRQAVPDHGRSRTVSPPTRFTLDQVAAAIRQSNNEIGGAAARVRGCGVHGRAAAATRRRSRTSNRSWSRSARAACRSSCAMSRACSSVPRCGAASRISTALGDTVGGIVVMRHGENALNVISAGEGDSSRSSSRRCRRASRS